MTENELYNQKRFGFFKSLKSDESFKEFILGPLENKLRGYQKVLKCGSNIEEIYRAQGAVDILDYFDSLFQAAEDAWGNKNIGEKQNGI